MRRLDTDGVASRAPAIDLAADTPKGDVTTSLILGALLGVVTAAVATKVTQPLDHAVRRRHAHPRRGVARAVAIGIKEMWRAESQLATGWRKWLADTLFDVALIGLHPLFATVYVGSFYRWLGASIGYIEYG